MKFTKITNHKSPKIISNWIYVKYMSNNVSKSIMHKVMHVTDILPEEVDGCYVYKISHISSLLEPEYWQRDAVYQMMDNAIMTDALKEIVNNAVSQYASQNVYISHIDIGDDVFYISGNQAVYIISEEDAAYLIELFKNFNKQTVSKYRLNFLNNTYPNIYCRDKTIVEDDMIFRYVQAGTKLYVLKYDSIHPAPKILTYIFDGPFITQKDKRTAKAMCNSGKDTIKIEEEQLNCKFANNVYFLNRKDAENEVVEHINDSLEYVTRKLSEIKSEQKKFEKYKTDLKNELKKYVSEEK